MNVSITGGTGFLGSAIVRHLLAQGDTVRAIVRAEGRTERLPAGATARAADLADPAGMRAALAGSDAVIHAAALVSNWGHRWREFERVNVLVPVVVCEAAAAVGARRIAHIASFFALGPSDEEGAVNEDTLHDPRRFHNHYERSKTLGAERVRELADRGLPVVILYPGMLYGPGPRTEGNYVARTLDDFAAGRLPGVIGSGQQRWSFAHVDDVAAGIRRALEAAGPGARYVLGGENVSLEAFFDLLGEVTGIAPPRRHVGPVLAHLAGLISELRGRLTGRPPILTRDAAAIYRHHWACDSRAARRDLGYNPRPLAAGLRQWWQAQKMYQVP